MKSTPMPLTKSAKKALSVSKRRKLENDLTRAKVKSAVKGTKLAIKNGQVKEMETKLKSAYRELDLAAKKHIIHPNKAARLKSRLTLSSAKAESAPVEKKTAKK